jgi:hypothetical protein
MKLEHKKEEIVPFKKFLIRVAKYSFFAGLMVAVSMAVGTWGYWYFGNLSLLDSFQMSAMILTGMGPTETMTTSSAKLFSSFYALYSGVAFLSMTAVLFAPIVHRLMHILHLENDSQY